MLLLPSELALNYRMDTRDLSDTSNNTLDAVINPKKLVAIKQLADPKTPPTASHKTPTQADPLASTFRDESLYQTILQQLLKTTPEIQTVDQVLQLLQQGSVKGLGFERLVCYRIDADMSLAPISQIGCANKAPIAGFTLNLKIPSLIKKMTHKPLAVWVRPANRARIWLELPERFKSVCHPQSFALISLFKGQQPALMLYADRDQSDAIISEFQFTKFKQLAIAANHCILQLNNANCA